MDGGLCVWWDIEVHHKEMRSVGILPHCWIVCFWKGHWICGLDVIDISFSCCDLSALVFFIGQLQISECVCVPHRIPTPLRLLGSEQRLPSNLYIVKYMHFAWLQLLATVGWRLRKRDPHKVVSELDSVEGSIGRGWGLTGVQPYWWKTNRNCERE